MNAISKSGFLFIKDNSICMRFQFDKEKYKFLYQLSESKYSKEEKLWYIPLRHLKKIFLSKYFSKNQIDYQISDYEIEQKIKLEENLKKEAFNRITQNPFSVSLQDIFRAEPDAIVILSKKENSLRLFLKPRTKIKQKITSIKDIIFLKDEHSFFLPIDKLNFVLKIFRDDKICFAVEEKASNILKIGSDIRKKIFKSFSNDTPLNIASNNTPITKKDLENALLYPFVFKELDSNGLYSLNFSDNHQLTAGLKHIKNHLQRKKIAQNFSENELKKILFNFQSEGMKCYKTSEVEEFLKEQSGNLIKNINQNDNSSNIKDEDLSLFLPDICFAKEDTAILLIKKDIYNSILFDDSFFSSLTKESHNAYENHFKIELKDSTLLEDLKNFEKKFLAFGLKNIIKTKSFLDLIKDIEERKENIACCEYFRKLKDSHIGFNDCDFEKQLFPHQRVAISWLLKFQSALLGDDMGLGKTLSVLSTFKFLREKEEIDLLLVVCPNSLTTNWEKEANHWTPDLWVKPINGTKGKREKILKKILTQGVEIAIINYESARLEGIADKLLEIAQKKKVLICFDESQKLKNPTSKTFKALRKIAFHAKRKILLSGTPIPCNIVDIWSQMLILDDGKRFGTNFYAWLTKIAEVGTKWSEFAVKKLREKEVNEVIQRVSEILLRRKKEEVINLPEKLFSVRDLEMVGEQKAKYDSLCKDLLVELKNMDGETYTKQIDSVLEQYLRAVQLACNPRLLDETWKGEPIKFLELDDIVEELVKEGKKKLVIWTNYKKNVDELVERYEKLGTAPYYGDLSTNERQEIIDKFQDKNSDLKILIGIPAAGGVGITLHQAQTAVYLDKTWNAEHWLQSVDRIHRIGQTGTVNIISLHSAKVDNLIYMNLRRKEKQQALMLGDKKTYVPIIHPSKEELIEALLN